MIVTSGGATRLSGWGHVAPQRPSLLQQVPRGIHRRIGQRPQRVNKRGPKHGLSVLEQDALLRLQGHKCPCCLKPFTEEKPWVVEHDHALAALHGHPIGRGCKRCVRGLTCVGCNNFITQVERRDGFFERVWNHIHSRRDS